MRGYLKQLHVRCGYTGHFLTWEIALLPRETAFSSVTDVSRGKFPVLNIHTCRQQRFLTQLAQCLGESTVKRVDYGN